MANLGTNFLILFGLSSLLAFVFPFFKDGVFKQISVKPLIKSIVPFLLVLVPFGALFGLAAAVNIPVTYTLPCFAGAAFLSFVLSKIGLPGPLRGVLLLAAAYTMTALVTPQENVTFVLTATILGLVAAKLTDHLLLNAEPTLDDILPPLIWLTTVALVNTQQEAKALAAQHEGLVLGIMCVANVLRIMQRPFTKDDRVFIKRVVLATSGGLGVLLVITKLVLNQSLAPIALLSGAAMFATYLFQNIDRDGQNKLSGSHAVKLLIIIGMLTMVATRFYGMFGLLCMAPAAMVAPWFGVAQFAGLFFCLRALMQIFIATYNSNVTGVNIEHAYVGAAQYAGFIAIACLTMLLKEIKDRRVLTTMFIGTGAFLPIAANYYLHAEPTCSLLVAGAVAAIIFAALGPALIQGETVGYENLLLLPVMMVAVGVTFGGLIDAGNEATNQFRTNTLAYVLAGIIVCLLISWLIKFIGNRKPPLPSAAE